ncbi:mechanosensitive ion channel domain-containing protein [Lysobacter sp. 1R34A]|uniref:mechanosensitive ion channel family protein n=1 Tax=Lysobacter sp. 1R34A TaxID=3445786 RepID=UPI003EEBDE5B
MTAAPTAHAPPSLETDPEMMKIVSDALTVVSNPTDLLITVTLVLGSVLASALITRRVRPRLKHRFVWLTLLDYLATPLLTLALLSLFGLIDLFDNPLIELGATLIALFCVLRVFGATVELLFRPTATLRFMLRVVTVLLWIYLVLQIFGTRNPLIGEFFAAQWSVLGFSLTTRHILDGLTAGVVIVIVALWGDKAIGNLLRRNRTLQPNFVLALSRIFSVLMWIAALALIFSISGINLTALAAFSGALGIGLGLGLQRLAASYISGLIVLFEQSVRVGDNIATNNVVGRVTRMTVRYTMIRTRDGVEAIVPNDSLTSNVIVNQSWSDRNLRLVCGVLVKGDTDTQAARVLFLEAMNAQDRVLQQPPPHMYVTGVNDKGIQLDGHFWINDPENGQHNVASDIYDAVLQSFRKNGIALVAQ